LLDSEYDEVVINAEKVHSSLRKAMDQNIKDAFSDFGAISNIDDATSKTGTDIAISLSSDQIAYNTTHMCPYNNNCPPEVVKTTGKNNCGQCYASIKTVDHLPRIIAHIRSLHSEVEQLGENITMLINGNHCSEAALNDMEIRRNRIASEEAGWIAAYIILEEFRKDSSKRDRYLVRKPEIIEKHLESVTTIQSPLTTILLRVRDAKQYPEYFTPQLKANIIKLRNKILALNNDVERIINQPTDYTLLDDFRGIIRSICDATETSIDVMRDSLSCDLPEQNINLLETL
jgi:hypothetical protein